MPTESAEKHIPISEAVLLLVDFINPLDFDGADDLTDDAVEAAKATAALKKRLSEAGVPTIYANDNYGSWHSDFNDLVIQLGKARGTPSRIARLLHPTADDLTILKPRHSAFYASPLSLLLDRMQAKRLIITGLATDICVQFTAMDAFLRGYSIEVPADCTAAESPKNKQQALEYMERIMRCGTAPSASLLVPDKPSAGQRCKS